MGGQKGCFFRKERISLEKVYLFEILRYLI